MKPFSVYNKIELIDKNFSEEDEVLDVGFWGQGKKKDDINWPHKILKNRVKIAYGLDLECDFNKISEEDRGNYFVASAEKFDLNKKFDAIFAGDLIEHLSNPGLFLDCSKKHLNSEGKLIITTPNAFNLFVIAGKLINREPVVNPDHTFYFNIKTLRILLEKNGWEVKDFGFMYTLEYNLKESFKKKFLNVIYYLFSLFTNKFFETLIVVAVPKKDVN